MRKGRACFGSGQDITEYLATLDLPAQAQRHHRRLSFRLLDAARPEDHHAAEAASGSGGFTVRDPAEGHLCCGSAGTYNILQPEISATCARKVKNIEALRPNVIATGNIGCITQIATAAIPISTRSSCWIGPMAANHQE